MRYIMFILFCIQHTYIYGNAFTDTTSVQYENYELHIVTHYENGKLEIGKGLFSSKDFLHPTTKQEFFFFKEGELLGHFISPAKKCHIHNRNKNYLNFIFLEVGIVKIKEEIHYLFNGYGGCNGGCPNIEMLCSLNGNKILLLNYDEDGTLIDVHEQGGYSRRDLYQKPEKLKNVRIKPY